MIEDLSIPVEMVVCPIVREKDGLAMSSRNAYLSPEERSIAPILRQALQKGKIMSEAATGVKIIEVMKQMIQEAIQGKGRIDYVDVVDARTLLPVPNPKKGDAIVLAVWIGKTRLIDNILL